MHYQISDNLSLIKSSSFLYGRNGQIKSCPQLINSEWSYSLGAAHQECLLQSVILTPLFLSMH